MARNDGRTAARDKFGKPGVTYPDGSLAHPTINEEFTAQQEFEPKAMLTAHDKPATATALLTAQDGRKGDNSDAVINEKYETLPGVIHTTTRLDDDGGAVTVTRQRMVNGDIVTSETLSASPTGTWTKNTRGEGDANVGTQVTESRAIPGNVTTAKYYDPETDSLITETRQLVAFDATEPPITSLFSDFRSLPNSQKTRWFVTRIYPAGVTDKTFVEHEPSNYTYPPLMSGVATAVLTRLDQTTLVKVTPVIEAERPRLITKKITRTFTTTSPTNSTMLTGIYVIQPIRHRYDGVSFNLITGPVLCDGDHLTYTTGTDDPTWGAGVVETYTWSASVPTYTAYLADRAAGNWKVIYRGSKKLASGLWMITTVEIPIL